MTARYVHELFECEGPISSSRFAATARSRAGPGLAAYTISAIAFECGFPICPSFNRVLRRIQSATPRILLTRHFAGVSEGRTGLATCATKSTLLADSALLPPLNLKLSPETYLEGEIIREAVHEPLARHDG